MSAPKLTEAQEEWFIAILDSVADELLEKSKEIRRRLVAKAVGIAQGTLSSRLDNGWTLDRATSTPINPSFRRLRGDK